jgi:hypothetical protein
MLKNYGDYCAFYTHLLKKAYGSNYFYIIVLFSQQSANLQIC